jgi:hypothetical protein
MIAAKNSEWRVDALSLLVVLAGVLFLAALGLARAVDRPFAIQMWTMIFALLAGVAGIVVVMGRGAGGEVVSRYENGIV